MYKKEGIETSVYCTNMKMSLFEATTLLARRWKTGVKAPPGEMPGAGPAATQNLERSAHSERKKIA